MLYTDASPYCIRDVGICGLWCPWGGGEGLTWNQCPMGTEEWLYSILFHCDQKTYPIVCLLKCVLSL